MGLRSTVFWLHLDSCNAWLKARGCEFEKKKSKFYFLSEILTGLALQSNIITENFWVKKGAYHCH